MVSNNYQKLTIELKYHNTWYYGILSFMYTNISDVGRDIVFME